MNIRIFVGVAVLSAFTGVSFAEDGEFRTGCNYWASNAGMYMWRRWEPQTVAKDLEKLSEYGVNVMRVFPLWSDFQPLTPQLGAYGRHQGVLQADRPLANPAGVDDVMLGRFRFLCDEASKRGIRLVVGLVTGWMSGRLFVPPAFEGRNVVADPEVNLWQVRFIRRFVTALKDHPAIVAWDLGNECNCLADVGGPESWRWMNTIAGAIRAADPTRPIVSGMHSPQTQLGSPWCLQYQGELTDVLCTHPYPLFTAGCSTEPFDSMRSELHPTAESLLYAGMSGRPCFVEEAGDLGRCTASPERAAANLRTAAFSAWAHGLGAYVWWCGFDQAHLDFPPYTGNAIERELGLFAKDYEAKPTLKAMKEVRTFVDSLPAEWRRLPPRRTDAVCLVSSREGAPAPWLASFGAFLLAKQAGIDLVFADAEKPLPESALYFLPSGQGYDPYTVTAWNAVLGKVRAGATLFVSKGNATRYSGLFEATGTRIERFMSRPSSGTLVLDGREIAWNDATTTLVTPVGSRVLAADKDGRAMVTVGALGRGKVIFCNYALENGSIGRTDCFDGPRPNPAYLLYRKAAEIAGIRRRVTADAPGVVFTEHAGADGKTLVVALNCGSAPATVALKLDGRVGRVYRGTVEDATLSVGANDAAVFEVK